MVCGIDLQEVRLHRAGGGPKVEPQRAVSAGRRVRLDRRPRDRPDDSSTVIVQSSVAALTVSVAGRCTENSNVAVGVGLDLPPERRHVCVDRVRSRRHVFFGNRSPGVTGAYCRPAGGDGDGQHGIRRSARARVLVLVIPSAGRR